MKGAWVTLATNDSYSLGALVLAYSLKQVGTTQELAILVTPGVTNSMRTRLSEVFNLVKEVNVLDSRDQSNLRLLQRPELGITFTKLHCWRLTQYEKCVFLDADTLVLQNCDELFEREEFSAAPDVGWPDCFNSGVFVYRPSGETFDKLIQFAIDKGSFDGGDQGLLNLYFSDWAHKDISKHLPFIYNVCSTAFYSYLPAFKQFGKDVKILHFIGNAKPWLQYFDTETRKVQPSGDLGHLSNVLQRWWDIFCHMVHPNLSPDMSGLAGAFSKLILGQHRSPEQEALENTLRRQNWEQGNIDYLGKDSFDNIWSKICETLSKGPQTEEAAEEPQVVALATTAFSKDHTEQQGVKERQSSQEKATAAETRKEEQQAGETKQSSVASLPVEEIDATPREEAVCALSISEKDNEVPLKIASLPSSEIPSKLPTETPTELASSPAISTDKVLTPKLSASASSDDVQVTKEKELSQSTSLPGGVQTERADIDSTPTAIKIPEVVSAPVTILQENVSSQSQLPGKTNETLPIIPQGPTKLEEAIQVISLSGKTSETFADSCVAQQKESAKSESTPNMAISCVPQSLDSAQTPTIVEKSTSAQAPAQDVQDSRSVQTLSSHAQTPTTQIPTQISKTPPQEQTSNVSHISTPEDISTSVQTSSAAQTSFPQQSTPQAQISPVVETSSPSHSPVEVNTATASHPCAEISVTAVTPQITPSVKTSAPSTNPADTSLQLEATSVKKTVTKDSQASQPHAPAASSHVPSETKQAVSSPSANVEACPIAPPPRKSAGAKKQGKSKK